jgi:hypothetical protein
MLIRLQFGRDFMVVFTDPKHCRFINTNPQLFERGWGFQVSVRLLCILLKISL